jgi:MoxR-like ATPase
MNQMISKFHIVYRPDDWQTHDRQQQAVSLKTLEANADIATARHLENAAERFRPSNDLLNAINAALAARVPLILTGEPGTGKTQVAWFLKRFFNIALFEYQVRSNSQSADLRYDFDAVAYLRDAYLAQHGETPTAASNPTGDDTPQDPRSQRKYLKPGPLWEAYQHEGECLLLIDEIDKAPRDFPNDLLQEIDQHRFAHPFQQGAYVGRKGPPPIILITSNGERRLPDAFLRRCIVHHIELTNELLRNIMLAWESQFPYLTPETRELALLRFQKIREINRLSKKPGAAELLLWLSVLSAQGITADKLAESIPLKDLPALMCLIKDHADYQHLGN